MMLDAGFGVGVGVGPGPSSAGALLRGRLTAVRWISWVRHLLRQRSPSYPSSLCSKLAYFFLFQMVAVRTCRKTKLVKDFRRGSSSVEFLYDQAREIANAGEGLGFLAPWRIPLVYVTGAPSHTREWERATLKWQKDLRDSEVYDAQCAE